MTPDLMKAGAQARVEHARKLAATAGRSGGRETSYSRVATGELDVTHGAILYLDDITVSFDGFKALNALSLSISAGELRCIIGPNGAGKTTMMDVITGKTRPDLGQAFFGSTIDLLRLRENDIASIGIGRKFQKPTVFEHLSVFENLELALKADRGVRASMFFRLSGEQLDRIGAMLSLIHLKDSAQRTAGLLSHGQKQWLEIGMLLMQDPKLLLLDEPVAGMTDEETERTAELFLSLEGNHSLVVVEHDMKFVGELTQNGRNGKKVTVLHEGSVLAEGLLSDVQANEKVVEVYLGAEMLKVEGVNQYYGGSHILRNVGFEAKLGEVTVILGRNGVGKTTLLKSLMGVVPVKTGTIQLDGTPITKDTPYERVRKGVGYVPQGREIFGRLTVQENLQMGLAYKSGRTKIPAELFELFPVLKTMINRRGGDLSGGQQQQLAIARALAAGPKLLILDEPTEGIQPSIIQDIGRVIRMLAERGMNGGQKMAIVLVEQFYDFAAELADQYLVMERGEIIQRGRGKDMEAEGVRARMSI